MNIEIKGDDATITLSDDALDNDNFIGISIGNEEDYFSLDDLSSAVKAFENKRKQRITRENKYNK
jgi:hypothetical protein